MFAPKVPLLGLERFLNCCSFVYLPSQEEKEPPKRGRPGWRKEAEGTERYKGRYEFICLPLPQNIALSS